ncbi:MAG: DUF1963 domain-containing protein [Gemmataceae bacterium]|nr:DUF1963 domain-containing protein [Gemmataceae bacterium]
MLSPGELRVALHEAGLRRIADALSALSQPCVLVCTQAHPDEDFLLGRSRIGGVPDLPPTVDWPCWHGKPLSFLAQFDLSDLKTFTCCQVLPSSGHLWFFYETEQGTWGFDPSDRGSWQVIYAETDLHNLQRREAPALPKHAEFLPCALTFHDFLSIPGAESLSVAPLQLSLDEMEQIQEIEADLQEMIPSRQVHQFEPYHQLLGHSKEIQGEMQVECQLAANGVHCGNSSGYLDPRRTELQQGATDWRLLFQLDSDDKPGMMWGDCGRLYFWIRNQDLASKAFDKSWVILQCS